MPKFRQGTTDGPLLPAPLGSSLGIPRRKSRTWGATLVHAAPVLLVTLVLFPAMLFILMNVVQQNQANSADGGEQRGHSESANHPLGPRHTEALQRRLDEIIQEATQVAREQGIVTETDAAEEEKLLAEQEIEDWSHLLRNKKNGAAAMIDDDASLSHRAACTTNPNNNSSECSPHGVCLQGRCHCVAAFTGRVCGHGIWLSSSFLQRRSSASSSVNIGYEGDFVVRHGDKGSELLQNVYDTCAVVGPGKSLLVWQHGSAIDKHDFVFRIGNSDVITPELAAYVGRSIGVLVLESSIAPQSQGLKDTPSEDTVEILRPEGTSNQSPPPHLDQNVFLSSSSFEEHVAAVAGTGDTPPSAVFYSTIMALNMCRSVTLYGVAPTHGIPGLGGKGTIVDPCAPSPSSLETEYAGIYGLVRAGLARFGEQCADECRFADSTAACSQCIMQHGGKVPLLERIPRCETAR